MPTIEIWKDVGGFMSADPKIVPEAFPLSALSYDEAAELSYFGAKALHPRSVQPAQACGASIVLKNITRPDETGTRIGPDTVDRSGDVKSNSYAVFCLKKKKHVHSELVGGCLPTGTENCSI